MKLRRNSTIKIGVSEVPIWVWAFFLNLLVAMLAICPLLVRDNGYFAMSHDFSAQELGFNMFMNRSVKSGDILWNWGIDLGGNFLEAFSFYNVGSVFFWVSLLFPASSMPRVMPWIIILKFAVAGGTSAAYCKRHLKSKWAVLIASLLYAFSGFQCSSVVFYHFQDVVALFPLMLIGLEMLVEEKKRGRLAFACVLNVLCNYVFFVGEVIFLVLYYVVKYLLPEISQGFKKWKDCLFTITNCMAEGALGMAVSGVLLIPSIHGTLSNSRVSEHLAGESWLSMSTADWLLFLKGFLTPAEPMNYYSSVTWANWMTNAAYLPLFGVLFVIAYVLTKKDWLSRLLKICCVIAVIPILNNMFMFFSVENYRRWYYMFILLMALATAKVLEQRKKYCVGKAAVVTALLVGIYFALTSVIEWNERTPNLIYHKKEYYIGLAVSVGSLIFLLFVELFLKKYRKMVLLLLTAGCSVFVLSYSIRGYQNTTDNTNIDFKTYQNPYAQSTAIYLTEIAGNLDRNVFPYRYYFNEGISHTYYNLAMTNSLPSINSFISTVHSSVTEFYDGLGIGRGTWTNVGQAGTYELLSAKHVLSVVEQPYQYISTVQNQNGQSMYVYENEDALPIGFTYDSYITKTEFENLESYLRSAAMLTTLVVEDEDVSKVERVLKHYSQENDGAITTDVIPLSIEKRRAESSQSFEVEKNTLESVITASSEKYAFFSVPYDKYWKAQVNGEDTEVLKINGLMAVRVGEGENRICFSYEYAPLKWGIVCSVIGGIVLALYILRMDRKILRKEQ